MFFKLWLAIIYLNILQANSEYFISNLNTTQYANNTGVFYIAGGTLSLDGEFPFMAALGWIDEKGKLAFHGGGMLISPRMVLTAAHCVYKNGKLPDVVFIGGKPLSTVNDKNKLPYIVSKFTVAKATIHPDYDRTQGYDDIALIELNEPSWGPNICLWPNSFLPSNNVTAIGYGLTEFAGLGSQNLLKVNLTVFSSDFCEPFFKRQRKFKLGLSDTHICAGDLEGIKDTCQGDSGGPLIILRKNAFFAVGITSSGQACSGFPPAIYTRISTYIDWITALVREVDEYYKNCVI